MFARLFSLLILSFCSWAHCSRCPHNCGSSYDPEVDKIAEELIDCLRKLELVEEPKTFWESYYDEDEDEEEEIQAYCWMSSRYHQNVYGVKWKCIKGYEYTFNDWELSDPETTMSLIQDMEEDVEEIQKMEIQDAKNAIEDSEEEDLDPFCFNFDEYNRTVKKENARIGEAKKKYHEGMPTITVLRDKTRKSYLNIYANCIQNHKWAGAFYHRGFLYFDDGDFYNAMTDIGVYLESDDFARSLYKSDIQCKYGTLQNLLGEYHKAIETLSQVIEAKPKNKEAYLERATAYFELGNFDSALEDYLKINERPTSLRKSAKSSLEFAEGMIKGVSFGAADTLENFLPSMLCSLQGLANGIWAFALDPKEVSKEMVECGQNIYAFINDHNAFENLKTIIPELGELTEDWNKEPQFRRGELVGTIIGKYGTDVVLLAGSTKAIKLFHELRVANAALTLETMKSLEKRHVLEEMSIQWKNKMNEVSQEILSRKLAKELGNEFKNQNLTEYQARKLLHNIDMPTFSTPQGIHLNEYNVKISDRGGGMRFIKKKNDNFEVRIMPGNPNSPNASQRKPYVVHRTPKGRLDKNGKVVPKKSAECHIPLEEYDFEKLMEIYLNEK